MFGTLPSASLFSVPSAFTLQRRWRWRGQVAEVPTAAGALCEPHLCVGKEIAVSGRMPSGSGRIFSSGEIQSCLEPK